MTFVPENTFASSFQQPTVKFPSNQLWYRTFRGIQQIGFRVSFCLIFILLGHLVSANVGDTLNIRLWEAEKLFLDRNLYLLSQKYFIEESKANEISAKLYANPNLHFEINAYNPNLSNASDRYFNLGPNGQQLVNVNQLVYLAQKRNKRIALAQTFTQLAEYQFFDLLRTLKYTVRTSFLNLYTIQKALQFYNAEIPIIERTVFLYETQFNKGNLSLKEVVRLKSLLFSLQTEKLNYLQQFVENQKQLNLLLQTDRSVIILPVMDSLKAGVDIFRESVLPTLVDTARKYRYDVKSAEKQWQLSQRNLTLQKALAVPDPTLGITLDRNSNYISNYVGPVLDIPMPFFDRNQGNIQAAKIRVLENEYVYRYASKQLEEEVTESFSKALYTGRLYRVFDQGFTKDFDVLIDNVISNFEKRNISLIEFIDLYESYKAATLQRNQLENDRWNTLEDLNFKTGKVWFDW